MQKYNFIATTTFGLESTVKRECQRLGFEDIKVQDGRVDFTGDFYDMAKANIHLRSADRVLWNVGEFKATTFEELFQGVKRFDWQKYLPMNANFHVNGKSVKSQLSSVPACQKITEKAIIEKMKTKYDIERFPKNGELYTVQVSLLRDTATITIDTSGDSLHKRGYREKQLSAPLKETLAHALIELSYWRKDRVMIDPCCGSGTLPIETAMMARNIPAGLDRKFVSEYWIFLDKDVFKKVRKEAFEQIDHDFTPTIIAYDKDPEAIAIARTNAYNAGVDDCIHFECKEAKDIVIEGDYGVCITNPPYGERIGEEKEVLDLYRTFGTKFKNKDTWGFYCITSNEDFERYFGKRANRKRKLYNGKIKIDYYQYTGKPPKKEK